MKICVVSVTFHITQVQISDVMAIFWCDVPPSVIKINKLQISDMAVISWYDIPPSVLEISKVQMCSMVVIFWCDIPLLGIICYLFQRKSSFSKLLLAVNGTENRLSLVNQTKYSIYLVFILDLYRTQKPGAKDVSVISKHLLHLTNIVNREYVFIFTSTRL